MEPPAALRPVDKLQLLADALALEFSQSLASAQCSQALRGLLPGLEYLSIGVSNPAQGGAIVASANCATEGPTTLHLHDPHACAAGVALARGQPLQASLLNGAADTATAAWSDVQLMLAQAPDVTHLLCIPFGPGGSDGSGEQASPPACQHHAGSPGSGAGALLFGFAAAPQLDERRRAMLALLARCLPAPMARLSGDTLAFVNFATGSSLQCSCCCGAEEEEEEDEEEEEAGQQTDARCREDRGSGGGGGIGPSQALRVPVAEAGTSGDEGAPSSDAAGPSSEAWWDEPAYGKGGAKAAAAVQARAELHRRLSTDRAPRHDFRFSKPLMAAAEAEGEAIVQQNSLTLTFRSSMMEAEFGRWVAQHHTKIDVLFSALLMAAFIVICFVRPYRLIDGSSSWLAGLGVVVPALVALLARSYATWRERFIIAIRIYVVAFVNLVTVSSYEAHLPIDRMQQWVTLFMLTGAESLAVTALGFPVRLQLHLPLQFAAMGIAAWNLPRMCCDCFPAQDAGRCVKSSAAMAATFGCLLPTIVLRYIEQRSRALFANQLRAAAAHQA